MIKIRATITISPKTPIMGKPKKMSKLPISQEKKKKSNTTPMKRNLYRTRKVLFLLCSMVLVHLTKDWFLEFYLLGL